VIAPLAVTLRLPNPLMRQVERIHIVESHILGRCDDDRVEIIGIVQRDVVAAARPEGCGSTRA